MIDIAREQLETLLSWLAMAVVVAILGISLVLLKLRQRGYRYEALHGAIWVAIAGTIGALTFPSVLTNLGLDAERDGRFWGLGGAVLWAWIVVLICWFSRSPSSRSSRRARSARLSVPSGKDL